MEKYIESLINLIVTVNPIESIDELHSRLQRKSHDKIVKFVNYALGSNLSTRQEVMIRRSFGIGFPNQSIKDITDGLQGLIDKKVVRQIRTQALEQLRYKHNLISQVGTFLFRENCLDVHIDDKLTIRQIVDIFTRFERINYTTRVLIAIRNEYLDKRFKVSIRQLMDVKRHEFLKIRNVGRKTWTYFQEVLALFHHQLDNPPIQKVNPHIIQIDLTRPFIEVFSELVSACFNKPQT